MSRKLPARPNLDHLRQQAKTLLSGVRRGETAAVRAFQAHLPEARALTADAVGRAGFRLADAQSVIARQTGFASWPSLARHVQQLRALEGEWAFVSLEVDGSAMPAAAIAQSRLLLDGDRFRMESPEATYEGAFTIDVDATPPQIDIQFVEGPEAGEQSLGIYEFRNDQLTLCLGLVGATRPVAFTSSPGSGHALEKLKRVSPARPADVSGGSPPPEPARGVVDADVLSAAVDPASFDVEMTPLLRRLEGEWVPTALVTDGQPMNPDWLSFGSRLAVGNEVKVVFGGQVMVHVKVRIDDGRTPAAVDYVSIGRGQTGRVSLGIMDWVGDEVRFNMATPGSPRPDDFTCPRGSKRTLSQWRRRE